MTRFIGEVMTGVREHSEGYDVHLVHLPLIFRRAPDGSSLPPEGGRMVISAENEGGHNQTHVDLLDLLRWVKANHPDLLESLAA